MPHVTIAAALVAGMLSFLSPCVLPLVPPYLVYLTGTSLERFADAEAEPRVRRETLLAAFLFVLGFSTVFVALGAGASAIGAVLRAYSSELAIAAGIIIAVHGRDVMSVFSWLPGLQAVRSYRRRWLLKDIVAGVVLTTLWSRKAWPTRNWPACRRSPVCTRRSCACSAMRCSARPASWCSARTPRSGR